MIVDYPQIKNSINIFFKASCNKNKKKQMCEWALAVSIFHNCICWLSAFSLQRPYFAFTM